MVPATLLIFFLAFSIRASEIASVIVIPAHPTTQDSVRLSLVFPYSNPCCPNAAQVSDTASLWQDSCLGVWVNYWLTDTCKDTLCGKTSLTLTYRAGKLKAGNYYVWETVNYVDGALLAGCEIDTFTVTPASSTGLQVKGTISRSTGMADRRVYDIRGKLVSSSYTSLRKKTPGVYLFKEIGCCLKHPISLISSIGTHQK
jgi:hypothetical protein